MKYQSEFQHWQRRQRRKYLLLRTIELVFYFMLGVLCVIGLAAVFMFVTRDVDAAGPDSRCDACRIQPAATPRPTPIVIGLPQPTPAAPTLPPTDTLP